MAQPTNTHSTYDAVGNREDLSDIIYMISPTDTPFLNGIPKIKAKGTYHEWQTDALAAASATNYVIEGDEATTDAATASVRRGNYTNISDKVPLVSGTQIAVDSAGRANEMAYQLMKRGKELKRDVEANLLANNARVAGNDTTARESAGAEAWLITNTSFGATGANPTGDGTDARTDGTQRAFAESQLREVLREAWAAGGNPSTIMVGAFNKQALSQFSGGSTRMIEADSKKLVNSVDVYVGDFGELVVVPNRFMRSRSALVLDMDMWAFAVLRDFQEKDMAISGDYERKQLLVEYTLECRNEAASGIIADLTTS